MRLSAYFYGIQGGASERKCRRIFDAYPNTKYSSLDRDNETGLVCITYIVPDTSAKAISDLLIEVGFLLNSPAE